MTGKHLHAAVDETPAEPGSRDVSETSKLGFESVGLKGRDGVTMFLLCAFFLRLEPHCSAWGKRKMSLRIHLSRPSQSSRADLADSSSFCLAWWGLSHKKEAHNKNIVTPSRPLVASLVAIICMLTFKMTNYFGTNELK